MLSRVQIVPMISKMNWITRRQVRALKEGLVQCWSSNIKKNKNSFHVSSRCIYLCHCASSLPYTNLQNEQKIPPLFNKVKS